MSPRKIEKRPGGADGQGEDGLFVGTHFHKVGGKPG